MHCSAVVPQTPRLYYSNTSLNSPIAVGQWSTLPLSASVLLYCGADASPAPNYTLSYEYWNESNSSATGWGSNPFLSTSNVLVFTTATAGGALVSYTTSGSATMPMWAALNATALGVNISTDANIACTAVNALGSSTAVFNVTLVGMRILVGFALEVFVKCSLLVIVLVGCLVIVIGFPA